MASTEQLVEQQKCTPHGNPTLLRCATCDTPVCPKCGRLTEVGQKCLGCAPLARHGRRSRSSRITSAVLFSGAAVAVVAGIAYVGSDSFQHSDPTPGLPPTTVAVAPVGGTVTDASTTFSVNSLECTQAGTVANGVNTGPTTKECLLTVGVRNLQRNDMQFRPDLQRLIDATGRSYAFDRLATTSRAEATGDDSLLRLIQPGQSVQLVLAFRIPSSAGLTMAEFHGVDVTAARQGGPGARVKVTVVTTPGTTAGSGAQGATAIPPRDSATSTSVPRLGGSVPGSG